MRVRGTMSGGCAAALVALATAAGLLLLALYGWQRLAPVASPVADEQQPLAPGAECAARTCAQFLYDTFLHQCFAHRRTNNSTTAPRDRACAKGGGTPGGTCCGNTKEKCRTTNPEERAYIERVPVYEDERLEWAADGESGLRDVLVRRGERLEPGRPPPLAASTHTSSLIGHVFLGALLLLSAGIALCEVFRDRLREKRSPRVEANQLNPAVTTDVRRCSLADMTVIRHARRESVAQVAAALHTAAGPEQEAEISQADQSWRAQSASRRHRLTTAASFDSVLRAPAAGPRPSYRILGHRPPPLQRRSSFPVPLAAAILAGGQAGGEQPCAAGTGTQHPKLARRSSVEQSEEESSPDLRRRVRIIRRH